MKILSVFHQYGICGSFIVRGMRKKIFCLFLFLFLLNSGHLCPSQKGAIGVNQAKLKNILKKKAAYCERLKKMASVLCLL
jgi:hypothetical protein